MQGAVTRRAFLALVAAGSTAVGGLGVLAAWDASSSGVPAAAQQPLTAPRATGKPIEVRMLPPLALRTRSRREWFQVAFRPGITPGAIAQDEGLQGLDLYSIMAIVNGVQADFITPLKTGDKVELMMATAGG
jgi:hypothetical protein